jgi:protein gp37
MSNIEWTEKTWNPIVGCTVVSPGCTNCYAMKMAGRLEAMGGAPQYSGTTQKTRGGAVWTGKMTLSEKALLEPLKRKKPTTYFVNSMGDLFHEGASDEWIDRVFAVMALCPQHTFQVLTKRSRRMRAYVVSAERRVMGEVCDTGIGMNVAFSAIPEHDEKAVSFGVPVVRLHEWPIRNVWLGVSAEDQTRADERIPDLLATPAAKRFVSAEPLLGPIDFDAAWHGESALYSECWGDCAWCEKGRTPLHNCHKGIQSDVDYDRARSGLDWVIVGGESGHNARAMHPAWAQSIRDQCAATDVPFFFKQWGEWKSIGQMDESECAPLYKSNRIAKEHEDQDVINDLCGMTCTKETLCLQLDGKHTDPNKIGSWGHGAMQAFKIGKKAAGRALDGVTHDGMPIALGGITS